jgi:hypothetical protein
LTLLLSCAPDWSKAGPGFVGEDSDLGDGSGGEGEGEGGVWGGGGSLEIGPMPGGDLAALSETFSKYVNVFGVHVFASDSVPDAKVLHCAGVLAQYLDNDEDGAADDDKVVDALVSLSAAMVMFEDEDEADVSGFFESAGNTLILSMGLWADETFPEGSEAAGEFDATLEEVLHLVTVGMGEAYPNVFGDWTGTQLSMAMDLARGGHFERIPAEYPDDAWYHYDDNTCDYACMVVEYYYWVQSSLLGAQDYPGRCDDIANEWEPCTAALVEEKDPTAYALFTTSRYNLPTVLPDGDYGPV